ncbi:TniQ family protein [Pseudonocardia sp. RS11V-5]|uniref:TniQ family protein n=1 Tax=Pseudonocardia terrae TaxID=2905831 RepID=UPI001E5998FC|nr:TniQ family protein [Pseudonocardia terrae]MCE3551947.1 TniQ family protein [Pseudonocardia terrae]
MIQTSGGGPLRPGPLRRLPITLAPVHNETLGSFLQRLATVNYLSLDTLADAVAATRTTVSGTVRRTFNCDNLACVTGQRSDKLVRALPELRLDSDQLQRRRTLRACPRCTRRHCGGPVTLCSPAHQQVCVRHSLWLGSLGPGSLATPRPRTS